MRGRCGSSPLARGLPECRRRPRPPQGIIPARAGFTGRSSRAGCRAPDHPRSRGVYIGPESPGEALTGSSPLARGLPVHLDAKDAGGGIIPARAGFTPAHHRRLATARDHPRSRGVYLTNRPSWYTSLGSSPLARGLREPVAHRPLHVRIIPARAGFTEMAAETTDAISDHPRSRGVYVPEGTDPAARQGAYLSVVAIPAGLPPGVVGTGGGHRGSPVPQPDSQGVHPRCPPRTSLPCPR